MPHDTLTRLRRLQDIDGEIRKLRQEKDRWPSIVAEKEKDVEAVQRLLDEKDEEIRERKLDVESHELSLKAGEADIGKAKGTLLKVKTNREYEAILHEIQGREAENSMEEEKILLGLERIDALGRERKELEEEMRRARTGVDEVRSQAEEETREIEAEIAELEERKEKSLEGMDPEVLARYDRIREGRGGLAVVPVVDGVCQGCFLSLTSQEVNTLLVAGDDIITCRNCQRILYIEE